MILFSASCSNKAEFKRDVLSVVPEHIYFSENGGTDCVSVNSNLYWTVSAPEWIEFNPKNGSGEKGPTIIMVSAEPNEGTKRSGSITVANTKGIASIITVTQEGKEKEKEPEGQTENTLKGKKFLVIANSMVYYGGFVQKGNSGSADYGMFYKLMKSKGMEGTVIDCTQGSHYLSDYLSTCNTCKTGVNHLSGQDLSSFDYVILSEAGSNTSTFLSDCRALYKKVTDLNPNAVKVYINHIYSVYKKHSRILDNLETLHKQDGVIIVNCGQLAYDIYSGKVKVPGGSLVYSDRYTFCNHTSSDTYHPNPLMGYIMTQMTFCALTGDSAEYADYQALVKGCSFGSGSVSYNDYYNKYYTTAAGLPFMNVLDNASEMNGIQKLMASYINKY